MEFLIRREDGDWFDLQYEQFQAVLRPTSFESETIEGWGDHRICVGTMEISFSCEDPGIQVTFDGLCEESFAQKVMEDILDNLHRATGQTGYIVNLGIE